MCYDAHAVSNWCTNLYISSSYESTLLHWYCNPLMSLTFSASTPSPLRLFSCFPILSEPVLLPPTLKTFLHIVQHEQWTPPSINQLTCAKTIIYSDNSLWHKPLHIPNMAAVFYAINLSVTWTITHTKYGKAVIYAVTWTITRTCMEAQWSTRTV